MSFFSCGLLFFSLECFVFSLLEQKRSSQEKSGGECTSGSMSAVAIVAETTEKMLSSASHTTNSGAQVVCSMSCCVAPKQDGSHVSRLLEVLECALWLLLWQRRSFFGSLKSDVVQMYPMLQAIGLVRFFFLFRPSVVGSESKQPCFLVRQSRLASGNLTKPAAVTPLHSAFYSTGCCRLAKATEQEND